MFTLVSSTRELAAYRARLRWFGVFVSLVLGGMLGRIAWMQVVAGEQYLALSRDNFLRVVRLPSDRGLIRDARGRAVAVNRPSYTVAVTPHFVGREGGDALERVIEYVGLSRKEAKQLRDRIEGAAGRRRFESVIVRRDVGRDALALLETHKRDLPGVHIHASSHRTYPYGEIASHLVGYMNQVSPEEITGRRDLDYRSGEFVGRSGVERAFERELRGDPGQEKKVVDARGLPKDLHSLLAREEVAFEGVLQDLLDAERRADPIPGKTAVLTADMKLQRIMGQAMRHHASGAVVAVDPRNGDVLGMFSKPTFNPASWTGRLSREEKKAVDENPFRPMMNKAVWSYFPGSTYKIVTALAALEDGVLTPEDTIECNGYHRFGNRTFRCWDRAGHGEMNLRAALKHSCDVWFYVAGERLGIDRLAWYARQFGFGASTGMALNGESSGLVPTKAWHRKHSSEGYQQGFALNTSVGQGDTRSTPLQIALAYSAVANGGELFFPQLLERYEGTDGNTIHKFEPRLRGRLPVKPEHLRLVVDGLTASVNEEGGTAWESRRDGVRVVGKTGTAQVRGLDALVRATEEERHHMRDHAWFVGYAPADEPEIVVVTFLEHGGSGGKHAAPVTMEIIDRYFREIKGWRPMDRTASMFESGADAVRAQ